MFGIDIEDISVKFCILVSLDIRLLEAANLNEISILEAATRY